jgi:hypothetical protein
MTPGTTALRKSPTALVARRPAAAKGCEQVSSLRRLCCVQVNAAAPLYGACMRRFHSGKTNLWIPRGRYQRRSRPMRLRRQKHCGVHPHTRARGLCSR